MQTVRWTLIAAALASAACSDLPTGSAPAPDASAPPVPIERPAATPGVFVGAAADSALLEIARARADAGDDALLATLRRERPWMFDGPSVGGRALPELMSTTSGGQYIPYYGIPATIYQAFTGGDIPCAQANCDYGWVESSTSFDGHVGRHVTDYNFFDPRGQRGTYARASVTTEGGTCPDGGFFCMRKRHHTLIPIQPLPKCDIQLDASTLHTTWWNLGLKYTLGAFTLAYGTHGTQTRHSRLDPSPRRDCVERSTSGGGGSAPNGGGTLLYICTWYDHYDGGGNYTGSEFGGCRMEYVNMQ